MADRRCPNCGELVPSNSITCPKCYRRLPEESDRSKERRWRREGTATSAEVGRDRPEGGGSGGKRPSRKVALALNAIPGIFGILGLGQMYMREWKRGAAFLVAGLVCYAIPTVLWMFLSIFSWFFSLPFYMIYIGLYSMSLYQVLMGPLFDRMRQQQGRMFGGFDQRRRSKPVSVRSRTSVEPARPEGHQDGRGHLRQMQGPHPVPDLRRVPGAQRLVGPPYQDVLVPRGSAQLPGQPDGDRGQQGEVPRGVPGLEAQVPAEDAAHVVGRTVPTEGHGLEVGHHAPDVGPGVQLLREDAVVLLHVVERPLAQVQGVQGYAVVVDRVEVGAVGEHPAYGDLRHGIVGHPLGPGAGHLHDIHVVHVVPIGPGAYLPSLTNITGITANS